MGDRWEYRPQKDRDANSPPDDDAGHGRLALLILGLLGGIAVALFVAWPFMSSNPQPADRDAGFNGPSEDDGSSAPLQPPAPTDYAGIRKESLDTATTLLERYPNTPEAYGLLAWLYQRFGDTDEAADCWKQCMQRIPQYPETYYRLGRYAKEEGRDEEALEYLQKAFDMAPDHLPGIHAQLGETLMNLGRMEEAVTVLETNLVFDSASPYRLLALGHAYLQSQKYEEAKDCFTRTIEKAPELTHAYYGLATACTRLGLTEDAGRHMAEFQERKFKDLVSDRADLKSDDLDSLRLALAASHSMAGMVLYRERDPINAKQHWLRAAFLDPNETQARRGLIELYRTEGNSLEAVRLQAELRRIQNRQGN